MRAAGLFKKGDFVILCTILILSATIICYLFMIQTEDKTVVITQNNHIIERIPLDKGIHREVTVNGTYCNIIEIDGSRVRFHSSTCGNHLCVATGWISNNGQSAICLPNQVMIKIVGKKAPEVDAIAGQAAVPWDGAVLSDD